jgi:Lon-like ATP-dependent protease
VAPTISSFRGFSTTTDDENKKKKGSKKTSTGNVATTTSSQSGEELISAFANGEDKPVGAIVPRPPISSKTVTFVVKDRPLIPEHLWNVSGTDDMLSAVLATINTKEPLVCIFYMPSNVGTIEAELPMNGTLARIENVWVNTNEGQFFIGNKGQIYTKSDVDDSHRESGLKLDDLIQKLTHAKVDKWEAKLNALSIVQRTPDVSKSGEIPLVEYLPPVKPPMLGEWDETKKKEFDEIWASFLNTVQLAHLPAMRRGSEDWKLVCCHLISLFPNIPGSEIQRLFDEPDPIEGVRFTIMLLEKEKKAFEYTREMLETIHQDQSKQMDRATKMELLKRIQRDLGGADSDKTGIYRNRLAKFDAFSNSQQTTNSSTGPGAGSSDGGKKQQHAYERKKEDEDRAEEMFWKEQLAKGGSPLLMPTKVRKVVEEELTKFESLEKQSGEYHTTRNYIDWLTSIPWGRTTADTYDVAQAETILNEDHYGMEDVKRRILEFVAVSKLKQSPVKGGKIICLVGPPGVGKTSIGQSVARALSKKFYRFSVGGMFDVAEIKGHRRTYIGSLPGKLVQMFKSLGAVNPLMMIDEIDKLGRGGMQGDPSAALLELLDPSQNSAFVDHYLDLPVDASQVLFICTANSLSSIRGPLLDRLEVIEVPGYDNVEKIEIAKKYLEPKMRQEMGLTAERFAGLSESALHALAQSYSREAGVRNLGKLMEKIYRRVALDIVKNEEAIPQITDKDLEKYVGQPKYRSDRLFGDVTPPGVVMGLAYDGEGGRALYVESTSTRNYKRSKKPSTTSPAEGGVTNENDTSNPSVDHPRGSISSTGNLGETMRESVALAYSNAKRECDTDFFDYNEIKLHVPFGGVPKDGPSAGITLTTSLLSLAWSLPIDPELAMTGEISLTGIVLPVGGIKEKVLASRRSGVKTLILPEGNRKDWEELPAHLRDGMQIHHVKRLKDVLKVVFPSKFA